MRIISKNHREKWQQPFILLCVELFFIVFSIHINPFEGIFTLRNIDIAFVLILYFLTTGGIKVKGMKSIDRRWIVCMLLLLVYVTLLMSLNQSSMTGHNSAQNTFNFVVMAVFLPFVFTRIETDLRRLAKALVVVTVIQSLIVIGCFLFPSFKSYIFGLQSLEDDFLYYRVTGLGIAGAGGTYYLFCGFIANCYYLLFCKTSALYYIFLIIILFATMLVGRTGFYTEVVLFVYTLVSLSRQGNRHQMLLTNVFSLAIATLIAIFIINYISSTVDVNYEMLNSSYNRLDDIYKGRTVDAIGEMAVPELTPATLLFGTGYGKSYTFDGTLIWNDSGYIMRYNGFGAIPALFSYYIFYWYLYSHLKKINDRKKRFFWLIPIVLLSIIEYKEEFVFYLSLPFVLIVFLKLELYNQNIYIINKNPDN